MYIIIAIIVIALVVRFAPKPQDVNEYIVKKKECPPHQWEWVELKDETGEIQGHRMVCKLCGPLSKLMGHGDV